jgi:hypothetical protein
VALEAPVPWRRRRPPTDASRARQAAAESLDTARTERSRQQGLADDERHSVIAPLRRIREKNHLAELFIETIERGRRDSGPSSG